MALLGFLPAPFWIAALTVIWLTSRSARQRLPKDARVPAPFGLDLGGRWRLSRDVAFAAAVGAPLIVGLALMALGRSAAAGDPTGLAMLICIRIAAATAFALVHVAWLVATMKRLEAEGALKP